MFRLAKTGELEKVFGLYQSVLGREFCVWNEYYPSWEEIRRDFATENLFVLTEGERLLGALSVVPENELDGLPGWQVTGGSQREIARVAVAPEAQGRGLALEMVFEILLVLRERGCGSVHLSVAKENLPALKTYQKAGFSLAGEADLFGGQYYLMEKVLWPET